MTFQSDNLVMEYVTFPLSTDHFKIIKKAEILLFWDEMFIIISLSK